MKAHLLLPLLLLLSASLVQADEKAAAPAPAPPAVAPAEANAIVGQWEIVIENDQRITLTFGADGKLTFSDGSAPETGTYQLDKSTTPHVLAITRDKDKKTTYSLCQIDGDQLKLSAKSAEKKEALAKDFGDQKTMLLKRKAAQPAAPAPPDPKLIGKWNGQAEDEKITIEFKADGTFDLKKNDRDPVDGSFTTRAAITPAEIDIKLGEKTGKAIYRIEGDRLTMTEPKDKRAKDFNAKSALIAERVKE